MIRAVISNSFVRVRTTLQIAMALFVILDGMLAAQTKPYPSRVPDSDAARQSDRGYSSTPPLSADGSVFISEQRTLPRDRHTHAGRPGVALPETPKKPSPYNVDSNRPFWDWQHATDDWGGLRPLMEENGITIDADLYWGLSTGLSGRDRLSKVLSRNLLNIDATFDTEKMGLWSGGTAFVSFQQQAGRHSQEYFRDFQGVSNIDTADRTQMAQAWLEQIFGDGEFRVKAGKVDANSEFAYVDYGSAFLNSSFGVSPTIFALPTYPDPATSVNLFWQPRESFGWGMGLYDGEGATGVPVGSKFFRSRLAGGSNLFAITEATFDWNLQSSLPGRLGIGGWFHNGDFKRFDGTITTGTGGLYAVADQLLWKENGNPDDTQGIGMSLQMGWADPHVSEAHRHFAASCTWTGALDNRDADVIGIGLSIAELTENPAAGFHKGHETVLESLYTFAITRFWTVTCDVQTVFNPGGDHRDPLVVGAVRNVIRL